MLMANEPDQNQTPAPPETPVAETQAAAAEPSPAGAPATPPNPTPDERSEKDTAGASEEKEGPLERLEEKAEAEFHKVEELTDADIRAAIRWLMGSMPQPLVDAFYTHHPKFKP